MYRKRYGIEWLPSVFRTLAHYEPDAYVPNTTRKYEVDTVIVCQYITPEMLRSLSKEDKQSVYAIVRSQPRRREMLEELITTADSERLHKLIVEGGSNPKISAIRGRMAEILVQKDIEAATPHGINTYRNSDIRYFNRRFKNGTEIDAIMIFYGVDPYEVFVENLETLSHLKVIRNPRNCQQ